jgi:hypothetical protein
MYFIDACASALIDGELVHIEDIVLHDANIDIRSPTPRTHPRPCGLEGAAAHGP